VLLHLSGGQDRFYDAGEIDRLRDVPSTDYVLRASPNDPGQTVTLSGTSVRRLVSSAYPIDQVGFVRFVRPDGTWATLSSSDLADPPPFADARFPLVFVDSVGTRYFRPVRDDRDANARDNLSTRSGQPLEGWVQTGRVLTVTATGDPADIDKGESVRFHASVTGARDGERLTVKWTFGDGTTATGGTARHTYDATGAYDALATVTGSRDSGGTSDLIRVNVGKAKGGPNRTGAPNGRPEPTAPRSGPSNGNPGARPGGTAATGSPSGGATTQETAPAESTPSTPPTPPDSAAQARRKPQRAAPTTPAGKVVSGLVLAANGVPLEEPKNPTPPLARSAARLGDAHPFALPVGGLAALSLMALGAWREAVSIRGRRGS
jgi:hypothetical protein